jgi:phosphate transport system permease protein
MNRPAAGGSLAERGLLTEELVLSRLKRRYRTERIFRGACMAAVGIAAAFLALLFYSVVRQGHTAFTQTHVLLEVYFDPEIIDPAGTRDPEDLARANYNQILRAELTRRFPDATGRQAMRELGGLVSIGAAFELQAMVEADPSLIGRRRELWLPADDDVDMFVKGYLSREGAEGERRLNDQQVAWIDALAADGALERRFNRRLLRNGDSREPELAGIRGAFMGSAYTLAVTLVLAFPLGVAAALYLEEFAPRNRWTDLIEVNINNLAAVPSIVFGLLGLAVFLNFFGLPRSAPLVGGLVLALMTLPRIIIPARAAIQAVPPSIEEAAYGLGASPMQVMFHHVLPLALPGILTGTIIGMAQALGESAPLLMIGMVAFIVDVPSGVFDPATVLPVQIYLWADSPERAFVERTSAAIIVLLVFLVLMNFTAVVLRRRAERRW